MSRNLGVFGAPASTSRGAPGIHTRWRGYRPARRPGRAVEGPIPGGGQLPPPARLVHAWGGPRAGLSRWRWMSVEQLRLLPCSAVVDQPSVRAPPPAGMERPSESRATAGGRLTTRDRDSSWRGPATAAAASAGHHLGPAFSSRLPLRLLLFLVLGLLLLLVGVLFLALCLVFLAALVAHRAPPPVPCASAWELPQPQRSITPRGPER